MSVAYVIMCDGCNETAWASPSLAGYRRALKREKWSSESGSRIPRGWDYCPKCTARRQAGTPGGHPAIDLPAPKGEQT